MRNKTARTENDVTAGKMLEDMKRAFDRLPDRIWVDALRFAQDMQQSSSRCGRRGCRQSSSCQMKFREGESLNCGAGLSEETIGLASALALFGGLMAIRGDKGEFV